MNKILFNILVVGVSLTGIQGAFGMDLNLDVDPDVNRKTVSQGKSAKEKEIKEKKREREPELENRNVKRKLLDEINLVHYNSLEELETHPYKDMILFYSDLQFYNAQNENLSFGSSSVNAMPVATYSPIITPKKINVNKNRGYPNTRSAAKLNAAKINL